MSADWLETYLDYTRYQVSPECYHRWVGLAVIGAAMERRVWLTRGYKQLRVFPGQIMVILVGKSAMEKKTTAVNFGANLLSHLQASGLVNRLPKKTSPNRLGKILERKSTEDGNFQRYPQDHPNAGRRVNSSGFLVAGELSTFFSTDAWNDMMAATVNDLNDAASGVHELDFMSYQVKLWNPLIGMIGGITPHGIANELPKAARQAGFFGRIIWVHSSGTDRGNPMTALIPEQVEMEQRLRDGLTAMAYQVGSVGYTRQGQDEFERWYWKDYHPKLLRMDTMGMLDSTGYWGRKDGHLLRVAMACMASRSWGQELYLRKVDIERAVSYLDEVERGFPLAMADIGVGAAFTEENTRILTWIDAKGERTGLGWVVHRDVARYAHQQMGMRKFSLDDCLARLIDSGLLEKKYVLHEKAYYYRRRWTQGGLMRRASEEGPQTSNVIPLRRREGEG